MKDRLQHMALVLLALLLLVACISILLNNASYNPDFSVADVLSGATKHSHENREESETPSVWGYSGDDLALSGDNYAEDTIVTAGNTYRILINTAVPENTAVSEIAAELENESEKNAAELENESAKNTAAPENEEAVVLLSSMENADYQKAVQNIAAYLEEQGYKVRVKECSETMMLSLVHAGHFDLFLMSEEGQSEKME